MTSLELDNLSDIIFLNFKDLWLARRVGELVQQGVHFLVKFISLDIMLRIVVVMPRLQPIHLGLAILLQCHVRLGHGQAAQGGLPVAAAEEWLVGG